MKYQYKSIFILIIICLLAYHAHSQHISDNVKQRNYHEDQYFELNQPSAGNQTYVARDYIKLEPGFSYTAQNSESFNGYTNPLLVFPPTQGEYGGPDADDDGIVGTIPGSYAVTQTGAATYNVPIQLPQGRAGMQPNLSIAYSSQAGEGYLAWDGTLRVCLP